MQYSMLHVMYNMFFLYSIISGTFRGYKVTKLIINTYGVTHCNLYKTNLLIINKKM